MRVHLKNRAEVPKLVVYIFTKKAVHWCVIGCDKAVVADAITLQCASRHILHKPIQADNSSIAFLALCKAI